MIMQNSPNQQDPDQDQRENGSMEDSTKMTIEFLRARLLAERSVSRTVRQRAEELAKRVVELEEQLKIVSLQRKKAEKAAEDVLAILENNGTSEFSEEFDSISDQEVINCESKVGNNSPVEEESSIGSKMRRNHTDELSGSELESSPFPGRSLSWKSDKDSPHSRDRKYKDSSTRRRSTSASTTSTSTRRRVAKSCRQICRRETRSTVEESQIDNNMLAPQDNGVGTCSEIFPPHSDIGPKILKESSETQGAKIFLEGPVSGNSENQRLTANASSYLNVHGSDKDMERALEHQAQLIGQYEEEEKAQREWEEKFRENNNSTPDSCEPGNHSDITEEREETKAHAPSYPVGTVASQDLEAKSKVEDVSITKESSKSQSDGFQSPPPGFMGRFQDQKSSSMIAHESPASDFIFPAATGKEDQQCSGNYSFPLSHSYHNCSCSEGPTANQSAHIIPSHAGSSCSKGEPSGSKNEHYALMPLETPNKLGSVLEALHEAKLSLKHKLNALPAIDGGSVGKSMEFSVGVRSEVPVGCAGLFRVPSDFHLEATTKGNVLDSNSQLRLTNYYPDAGSALTSVDRFTTSPYPDARSSVSTGDRHLAIPTNLYMESRSKIPTWPEPQLLDTWSAGFSSHKPLFGPSLGTGLPSSSQYAYNDRNMNTGLLSSGRNAYNDANMNTGLPSSGRYAYNDTNLNAGRASSSIYNFPTYPFYPDVMPRLPSNEGPRLFSSSQAGMPPANQFSFYDDHIRPNAHR